MTARFTICLAVVVACAAPAFAASPAPNLFDAYGVQQSAKRRLPVKAVPGRQRTVKLNMGLLRESALTFNLLDDVVVTVVRDRLVDNVRGTLTWVGHVDGQPESQAFLSVRGNTLYGTVQLGGASYEIAAKGDGSYEVSQIDPSKNPPLSTPLTAEAELAQATSGSTGTSTTPTIAAAASASSVIDVLVVYTPLAKSNAGGQAGIEAKIGNAVEMANQAYLNSQVDMQINLVGMVETQYVETGSMPTTLTALYDGNDGEMDEVPGLRDAYGADQVSLISADTSSCGVAFLMSSSLLGAQFAPAAYSVVHDDSVYACLTNQTLAHELGHNQGSDHNIENKSTGEPAYSYSYGHRLCQANGFRTIMAYYCDGTSPVSYFSNPDVIFSDGEASGTADANNALSLNNTRAIVAAFRDSVDTVIPAAPLNLTANTLSDTEIMLAWEDNSNNETGFRIERSTDNINWSEIVVTASNVTSYTDSGLSGTTTYSYRVHAYNGQGNSAYSNTASATTQTPCTKNAPTVGAYTSSPYSKRDVSIAISVTVTNNDSGDCTSSSYTLTGDDGTNIGSYALAQNAAATATWTVTAPSVDGNFNKTVTVSASGHPSANASVTVLVDGTKPSKPSSVTGTKISSKKVYVSWGKSTDSGSGIDRYEVFRNDVKITSTTSKNYTDSPTSKGWIYYVIKAVDKAGNKKSSDTVWVYF